MSIYIYPPSGSVTITGVATEATLSNIAAIEADILTQTNAIGKGLFFKPYDEIVPNFAGSTTDVYTSKLATVTQQTLTITYADSSKAVMTNIKVV
jgi:hypothetical protein